jgi:hypothetical protein
MNDDDLRWTGQLIVLVGVFVAGIALGLMTGGVIQIGAVLAPVAVIVVIIGRTFWRRAEKNVARKTIITKRDRYTWWCIECGRWLAEDQETCTCGCATRATADSL